MPQPIQRQRRAWYFYDWANSAFSTSVVTLFFGPYLTTHIARAAADARGFIYPFGVPVEARSYWEYVVAASVLLQALTLPVVGALADSSARKKTWLGAFAYSGAAATMAMFWLDGPAYLEAGILFVLANVALGASCVIYNSFLPLLAPPAERDQVSSKGWGIGYIGGGLLLGLNLLLYQNAAALGVSETLAVRVSLGSAGLWWALFTIVPMLWLENPPAAARGTPGNFAAAGFRQLRNTLAELRRYPRTLWFLAAYLIYNDAIQAVLALATQFGHDELKMPISSLTMAILMVQFVAFLGAFGFGWLARVIGAKRSVMFALVAWTLAIGSIYVAVRTPAEFFILAAVVALIMGGSQALSRSLFSLMIPQGREAEYFSLYELSDKGTSWLGPLVFGLTLQYTGSYRLAVLPLVVSFLAGLAILASVNIARGAREAGNAQ